MSLCCEELQQREVAQLEHSELRRCSWRWGHRDNRVCFCRPLWAIVQTVAFSQSEMGWLLWHSTKQKNIHMSWSLSFQKLCLSYNWSVKWWLLENSHTQISILLSIEETPEIRVLYLKIKLILSNTIGYWSVSIYSWVTWLDLALLWSSQSWIIFEKSKSVFCRRPFFHC